MYEIILSEALLCQHRHNDDMAVESEGYCTKAFSIEDDNDLNGKRNEAFQISVENGDPDEPAPNFTSLSDPMTTPPEMNDDNSDLVSIDFAINDYSVVQSRWNSNRHLNKIGYVNFNYDLVITDNYGSVTKLKEIGSLTPGTNRNLRY